MESKTWRKCGSCKKDIGFNKVYQICSVSTCKKLVFCSVDCWDVHNPVMNHKNSWAVEMRSPAQEGIEGRRIRMVATSKSPMETLIIASKLKQYIKEKYDMNTSASVMEALSLIVRGLTDQAASNARSEGRKTVLDRDFKDVP